MSIKLHHVGHIVRNLDDGMKLYEKKLGLTPSGFRKIPKWGARLVFFHFADLDIELIEPSGAEEDPAGRCLRARGEGLFHLSFRTDDFDTQVKAMRGKGFTVEEHTVPGALPGYTTRLAFLAPEETLGLWVEFVDLASVPPSDQRAFLNPDSL